MNYRMTEVVKVMKMLETTAKEWEKRQPMPDENAVAKGLRLSRQVTSQPSEIISTPIMKDLMTSLGDIKLIVGKDGEVHHTRLGVGEKTKAVDWINEVVSRALHKFCGAEEHDYPDSLPIDSERLYQIDCWNGWKEAVWDIQPGQEEQVAKGFKEFEKPKTNYSIGDALKAVYKDPALQMSLEALLDELPVVQASKEVRAISDPFMSKGTGVSYPDYQNDRTIYEGDVTYAKHEIDLTAAAAEKGIDALASYAIENNVYTGYARWQRGKGRPLIAGSRRENLVMNMVNGPEIVKWKETAALRAAFVDEEQLLQHLSLLGDWVLSKPDSDAANIDYAKWDQNFGAGWTLLQEAIRYMKAADEYTRKLILIRYYCNRKAYFVNGRSMKLTRITGRTFSGSDDTTWQNSVGNRAMSRRNMCYMDRNHIRDYTIPLGGRDLTVVGDDLLVIGKKGFIRRFAGVNNKLNGSIVHEDEKHARGIMFIQWRAFRLDGKWVMAYNWPRVLRSMLSKENQKQLGRWGWTIAYYQQLGKLLRVPKYLRIVVNIMAACDRYHLSLDIPVAKIVEGVKQEDAKRVEVDAVKRKEKLSKKQTTAEQLYNGNPNLSGVKEIDGKLEIDEGYFSDVQAQLRKVYDPEFLPNELGIKNPDLSKVSAS